MDISPLHKTYVHKTWQDADFRDEVQKANVYIVIDFIVFLNGLAKVFCVSSASCWCRHV